MKSKNQYVLLAAVFIVLVAWQQLTKRKLASVGGQEAGTENEVLSATVSSNRPSNEAPEMKPLPFPRADRHAWEAKEYKVLPTDEGVVAVQNGKKIVYATFKQVTWHPCKDKKTTCIMFPNGQDVMLGKSLAQIFPVELRRAHQTRHWETRRRR